MNGIYKLKEIKLDPSDKAEKIIRDIETVIRKNEVNSAIYVEFQNRLDELIKQKKEESLAIEEILNQWGCFIPNWTKWSLPKEWVPGKEF